MKTILRFTSLLCLLSGALFLTSCRNRNYSDTVSCRTLSEAAMQVIPVQNGYAEFDTSHIRYNFENTTLHNDSCIIYSADTQDINEIGIFRVESTENIDGLVALAEDYISDMQKNQRAFIESYAPEETKKLDSARIYVLGNYVIYTILSPSDRDAAINKIEALLIE